VIADFYVPCELKKKVGNNKNDKFEYTNNYSTIPMNGYLGSSNDIELLIDGKTTVRTQARFYCDNLDIDYGDLVLYESITYRVIQVPQNTIHKDHHMKLMLEKVV
jgi:hypothetical protein